MKRIIFVLGVLTLSVSPAWALSDEEAASITERIEQLESDLAKRCTETEQEQITEEYRFCIEDQGDCAAYTTPDCEAEEERVQEEYPANKDFPLACTLECYLVSMGACAPDFEQAISLCQPCVGGVTADGKPCEDEKDLSGSGAESRELYQELFGSEALGTPGTDKAVQPGWYNDLSAFVVIGALAMVVFGVAKFYWRQRKGLKQP